LLVFTTVCFPALQLNPLKKQFVATRKVPEADSHELGERPFVAVAGKAEAVTQNSGSISLA
jgi:hypothetical protein